MKFRGVWPVYETAAVIQRCIVFRWEQIDQIREKNARLNDTLLHRLFVGTATIPKNSILYLSKVFFAVEKCSLNTKTSDYLLWSFHKNTQLISTAAIDTNIFAFMIILVVVHFCWFLYIYKHYMKTLSDWMSSLWWLTLCCSMYMNGMP